MELPRPYQIKRKIASHYAQLFCKRIFSPKFFQDQIKFNKMSMLKNIEIDFDKGITDDDIDMISMLCNVKEKYLANRIKIYLLDIVDQLQYAELQLFNVELQSKSNIFSLYYKYYFADLDNETIPRTHFSNGPNQRFHLEPLVLQKDLLKNNQKYCWHMEKELIKKNTIQVINHYTLWKTIQKKMFFFIKNYIRSEYEINLLTITKYIHDIYSKPELYNIKKRIDVSNFFIKKFNLELDEELQNDKTLKDINDLSKQLSNLQLKSGTTTDDNNSSEKEEEEEEEEKKETDDEMDDYVN
jgi:hypothetical protein